MAVWQQSPFANSGTGPGNSGLHVGGNYMADPDIAAQGDQTRKTQQAGFDFKTGQFNKLLPMLQGAMAGAGNFNYGGAATNIPAPSMGGPHISGGPLWTQQAIQQNVNANRAGIDRSTATNNQNIANQAAGHGFGSGSPLTMALQNQANMSAMGQKADYERQFLPEARQQNAQFGLQAQNAQQQQFAANQQAQLGYGQNLIANQRNAITAQGQNQQFQGNLLGTLAGLLN